MTSFASAGKLDDSFRAIAGDITNEDFITKEARKAASSMDTNLLVNEAVDFLLASRDANSEAAAVRFILALETFPVDELAARYKKSATSTERAFLLHLLNHSPRNPSNDDLLTRFALDVIYDKGTGLRRYGEARAYSPEGKRVCDVAYNVIVSRRGLSATFPLLDVDNYSTTQRDQMIDKLGTQLRLPKPPSTSPPATAVAATPASAPVPDATPATSPQPANPVAQTPALPAERKAPVWPWLVGIVALVVIVALVFKRRT